MMPAELLQILTEIRDAFPFVKRRFNEAPRVVDEWTRALRPLAVSLVQDGISRWIRHSNIDPPPLMISWNCWTPSPRSGSRKLRGGR